MFGTAMASQSYRKQSQDRADVIEHADGVVIVVADGAGGMSGGSEAADTVVMRARAYVSRCEDLRDADGWCELLSGIGRQIGAAGGGQSTAVIAAVFADGIFGASVGDSAAWAITADGYENLTADQVTKPLLGSGAAKPVGFSTDGLDGTLLVATDGLVKYAKPAAICGVARTGPVSAAAGKLIDLVRLRSGALQDDVAVVLCREKTTA